MLRFSLSLQCSAENGLGSSELELDPPSIGMDAPRYVSVQDLPAFLLIHNSLANGAGLTETGITIMLRPTPVYVTSDNQFSFFRNYCQA